MGTNFYIKSNYFAEKDASRFCAVFPNELAVYGFDGKTWDKYPFDGRAVVTDDNLAIIQKENAFRVNEKECYQKVWFHEPVNPEILKRKKEKGGKVAVFIWSCQDQFRFDVSVDELVSEEEIKKLGLEHF